MNKNDYINAVICNIKSSKAREQIKSEIAAHIEDRVQYYTDSGMDRDTAVKKTIERMGEADSVAESFENLYSNDKYKTVSYIFTFLYGLGLIAGVVLALCCINYTILLDDTISSLGLCFGSLLVFICSVISLIFAISSKEAMPLKVLGKVSLIGAVVSPVTLAPCGYTVLSLIFDYIPDILNGKEFEYLYYPFENMIFPTENIIIADSIMVLLYVLMFLFDGFAIATGLLSNKFAKDYENSIELSPKNKKRAKIYIIILIVLSLTAMVNFTVEGIVTLSNSISKTAKINNEIEEAYYIFDNIELPFDPVKVANDNPSATTRPALFDEDVLEINTGDFSVIYIKNKNTKEFQNLGSLYYTKNVITNLNSKIKKGTTIDDFFTVFDINKMNTYTVTQENGMENAIIQFDYYYKNMYCVSYYIFEDGVLIDINSDSTNY